MSNKKMWFGNRAYMQWVPCPQAGADYGAEPAGQAMGYLNGGAFRRQTLSAAKTFQLTWNMTSRDSIRAITDFAEGVYGDHTIFWVDPFTADKNMLSQSFATPSLGAADGVILTGTDVRPELVPTSTNTLGYPTESAVYTVGAADPVLQHWIPIPPGHTAWVGVHGSLGSGSTRVVAIRTNGLATSGVAEEVPMSTVTDTTRVSTSFAADATTNGILVYLQGAGTITLSGLMVQVLPNGKTPETGGFISGQGHSGCAWNGMPNRENYSAAMDLVGLSASFIETGQWL